MEKKLTNKQDKTITVQWDGTNFFLTQVKSDSKTIIILNPKEMLDLVLFASKLGKE